MSIILYILNNNLLQICNNKKIQIAHDLIIETDMLMFFVLISSEISETKLNENYIILVIKVCAKT